MVVPVEAPAVTAGGRMRMMTMTPTYDRAAIFRDAHKRFRDGRRLGLGWSFSQCLSTAWAAAKQRRIWAEQREKLAA